MTHTDATAREFITRAIDGSGEVPDEYDIAAAAEAGHAANDAAGVTGTDRWDMERLSTETFWQIVMHSRKPEQRPTEIKKKTNLALSKRTRSLLYTYAEQNGTTMGDAADELLPEIIQVKALLQGWSDEIPAEKE